MDSLEAARSADPGAAPRWMPIAAAARALGVSERAIRRRIERGSLESRREARGNKVRLLVRLAAPHGGPHGGTDPGAAVGTDPRDAELAALRERLTVAEAVNSELRARVAAAEADRDRWHAEATRRHWPGLKSWWRRVWEGEP